MGHKGDIEAVYTLNKRKQSPHIVEEMREGYAKAQKFLQTVAPNESADDSVKLKRFMLLIAGMKANEIKDEHLELEEEEFFKFVRERMAKERSENQHQKRFLVLIVFYS